MSKDAPEDSHWAAVGQAVSERMTELGFSQAEVTRRSYLTDNTIRDIMQGARSPHKSSLAVIAVVLGWPLDYLVNILHGEADKNLVPESPLESHLADLAHGLAEIGALREDVAGIKGLVERIDEKIDVAIEAQRSPDDEPN